MPWWAWALVAVFAAIPTPTLSVFDGLPVDRPLEFIVFVLLAGLIASPAARHAAFGAFGSAGRRAIAGVVALVWIAEDGLAISRKPAEALT